MSDSSANISIEVELKLQTSDEALLEQLWSIERIGRFVVIHRRRLQLHNVYYDSPDHALDRARGNLRWRKFSGSLEAELTYKGPSKVHHGVFTREEVTAHLPADVDPLTVEPTPEPLVIARRVTENLAPTELVLENDRRNLTLKSDDARVELDLDVSTMAGSSYRDLEIEAELVEGDPKVLAELEQLISTFGTVTRAKKGKRARGRAFLRSGRMRMASDQPHSGRRSDNS